MPRNQALFCIYFIFIYLSSNHIHAFQLFTHPSGLQLKAFSRHTKAKLFSINTNSNDPTTSFSERNLIEHHAWDHGRAALWNPTTKRFEQTTVRSGHRLFLTSIYQLFAASFIPSGELNKDYYTYSVWRMIQRFVSSMNTVFGTQALILALGFKKSKIGLATATTWVLKDVLGKISRIYWAGSNGRKFDADAKKWKFRSSILFIIGNALELFTYIMPSMFFVAAALANALKQMAMLTSSATRNTLYTSFSRNSDNIGDITAKGEAQIAIIDILGMFAGILMSKIFTASKKEAFFIFAGFVLLDLFCSYYEVRSVVFNSLNFERTNLVLQRIFVLLDKSEEHYSIEHIKKDCDKSPSFIKYVKSYFTPKSFVLPMLDSKSLLTQLCPDYIAKIENMLHSAKPGEGMIRTWSQLEIPPKNEWLDKSFQLNDHEEKFLLSIHTHVLTNVMEAMLIYFGFSTKRLLHLSNGFPVVISPQILLHQQASQQDIFRALIILNKVLRDLMHHSEPLTAAKLYKALKHTHQNTTMDLQYELQQHQLDDEHVYQILKNAFVFETQRSPAIYAILTNAGWDMNRFSYGAIQKRVEW